VLHRRKAPPPPGPSAALVPPEELPTLAVAAPVAADRNLLPPLPAALGADGSVAGWRYGASDLRQQRIAADTRDGAAVLRVTHGASARWTLESPLIALGGSQVQSVRMRGRVRRGEGFGGTVLLQLVAYAAGADGPLEQVAVSSYEPRATKGEPPGALGLSRKIDLPKRATHLRFRAEATFKGVLELEQPSLTAETPARDRK